MDKLIKLCKFNQNFNKYTEFQFPECDIYRSKGLPAHLLAKKHYSALKIIDNLPEIISSPDYIGTNPNEKDGSIELVKKYNDSILIGLKLDTKNNYVYVSTMFEIQESKLERRINSGRLKKFTD